MFAMASLSFALAVALTACEAAQSIQAFHSQPYEEASASLSLAPNKGFAGEGSISPGAGPRARCVGLYIPFQGPPEHLPSGLSIRNLVACNPATELSDSFSALQRIDGVGQLWESSASACWIF